MTGKKRLLNFRASVLEVNRNQIEGSIVETGVWRGGGMAHATAVLREDHVERELYLFDLYDKISGYGNDARQEFLSTSVLEVSSLFKMLKLDGPNVHYIKGYFNDTLRAWKGSKVKIAVLRMDGNFYDSQQDALYYLYDKVPIGGILIFDDYGHAHIKQAWNDFAKDQGIHEVEPAMIDTHGAWFRKTHDVEINYDLLKPPEKERAQKRDEREAKRIERDNIRKSERQAKIHVDAKRLERERDSKSFMETTNSQIIKANSELRERE